MSLLSTALAFGAGTATARGLSALREHRAAPAGLPDLLQWGFVVDEGTVLQKDGSLLAGWRFNGPDLAAATTDEVDALSRHVNNALLPLGGGWMLHVDAIRRPALPYAASVFPDPVTQAIDDERRAAYSREQGRQFETEHFLVVTRATPPEAYSRFAQWFMRGADVSGVDWHALLAAFEGELRALQDRLSGVLRLERLGSDALVTHLHECVTGLSHRVTAPPYGSFLDYALGDQDLIGGFEPSVGEHAVRIVAVQGYPQASRAGLLDALDRLPYAFRWSNRVIPLSRDTAAKLLRRHQLNWFKKRKGATAWAQELAAGKGNTPTLDDALFEDNDARAMAKDAQDAIAENASSAVRFAAFTQVAVVSDPDPTRANYVAREILKALSESGFTGRVETVNALDAFVGSMPGHGHANLRRPLLHTRNIADLLPLSSVWPGLAHNPSPLFPPQSPPLLWAKTDGSTPFRLNLHDSDVGHTLILGKTGAGKSVLLATIAAQFFRYPRAKVFAFDVGYSMRSLAEAAGAAHYDLAAGRPDALAFQPLARIDEPTERAWAGEWLETVLALQGVEWTAALRTRLDSALALLARTEQPYRTLTELAVQLQHEGLVAALRPYTVAGPYGEMLDAARDDLGMSEDDDARFQVFELKHLMALDDKAVLPVLLYLFRRIEQRLDGRPTLILLDEAWMALMHSLFGSRVAQWLYTLRKQNAAVVLATQSASQLDRLPNRAAILESCVTKIWLPNPDALSPASAALYRELGLNEREIALLAEATPKRDYYFTSPRGRRLFELGLGRDALATLAPSL